MADIPVEKKSGTPWWLWLLGLLVLAALIWLLIGLFNDDEDEADVDLGDDTNQVDPAPVEDVAAAGLITSVATITEADDPVSLAGRQVQLSDMRVSSVLGDSAFYATPEGDDRRFLIALNEVIPSGPDDVEGRYDVTEGQLVDVDGAIRELTREADTWGLTSQQAQEMQNDAIYIRAQSLNIVEEAQGS